jgi:hypothetical protein
MFITPRAHKMHMYGYTLEAAKLVRSKEGQVFDKYLKS